MISDTSRLAEGVLDVPVRPVPEAPRGGPPQM